MSLDEELDGARKRVVTDGYDMSLGELISLYKEKEIDTNPEFQRLYRWTKTQKTRFIESLLLGIPFPPVFVFTKPDGGWELIDGLQRLSTVFEFAGILRATENVDPEQPLRLDGTKLLPSLAGKSWSIESTPGALDCLTTSQQLIIKRNRVRVEILKKESDDTAKYELFQRLNTGGSHLSEQEVRDCVLVMVNRDFFAWLKALANGPDLAATTKLTERDISQRKPTELCLRLLAYLFWPYTSGSGRDVHDYLDEAAVKLATDPAFDRPAAERCVTTTFRYLRDALGEGAFRRRQDGAFTGAFAMSAFEFISLGVASNLEALEAMSPAARNQYLSDRVAAAWENRDFQKYSGGGVRGTTRLKSLLPLAPGFFKP